MLFQVLDQITASFTLKTQKSVTSFMLDVEKTSPPDEFHYNRHRKTISQTEQPSRK